MDGVFNHCDAGDSARCNGFAYYHLYQNQADCPYVGNFEACDFANDLDYNNPCTLQFILDVCKYWIDEFKIDGIRFDNTKGFYRPSDRGVGLAKLLSSLRDHLASQGADGQNFMTSLEHSWDYDALDVVNKVGATSCWYDPCRSIARDMLKWRYIGRQIMRMLNASRDLSQGHVATAYIENHDHETFMQIAGSRDWWYMTQPWMIAMFTMPAAPMLHNGQEWGQMAWFPEPGEDESRESRVKSRPLSWDQSSDDIGKALMKRYKLLIKLRQDHPGLREPGFYPADWQSSTLDHEGYGVDEFRKLVVYTRFGDDGSGKTGYYVVALNFSDNEQLVVPRFPLNGKWKDLLSGEQIDVTDGRFGFNVSSNWGRVYYLRK
jgi:glycosidase